jgi:hypothetical protein
MKYHITHRGGWRERLFFAFILAVIALAACLLLAQSAEAYSDTPVAGQVRWAGPLHQGRQLVNFSRSDTGGWMQLPVSIQPGAPLYKRGDAILIFRAGGRVLGFGRW